MIFLDDVSAELIDVLEVFHFSNDCIVANWSIKFVEKYSKQQTFFPVLSLDESQFNRIVKAKFSLIDRAI